MIVYLSVYNYRFYIDLQTNLIDMKGKESYFFRIDLTP